LLPTLLDLCGVSPAPNATFDGISLATVLRGHAAVPDRTLIVQYGIPEPFRMTCVMRGTWRLLSDIKGAAAGEPELYDLASDPLQRTNRFAEEPAIAAELRAAYDAWWQETEPFTQQRAAISLGHDAQPVVTLSSAEWRDNSMASVPRLREGVKKRGVWDVEVTRAGRYEIELRRWPAESGLALRDAAPTWTPRDTATPDHAGYEAGGALPIAAAHVEIGGVRESRAVDGSACAAVFEVSLPAGPTQLQGTFSDDAGRHLCTAYFVTIRRLPAMP
jgi:arylsulfatase B